MHILHSLGDLCYLAPLIILFKLVKTRSCEGISGRTQCLYAIILTSRYSNLLCDCQLFSLYSVARRIVYLAATYGIVYLIYFRFKATYDSRDKFRIEFLMAPAIVLALFFHGQNSKWEIMWAFSIYLESVAILPQLFMIITTGEAEKIIYCYLVILGSSRALYISPYLLGIDTAGGRHALIYVVVGIVQTLVYLVFFGYKMFIVWCKQSPREPGFLPQADADVI